MDKKLSLSSYFVIGSMLFGLFFGAGNLIFPVHMGQLSGHSMPLANLGFLITAIGLPFLGVVAIGMSDSRGLFDLASRVHPMYGYFLTILLYMTIGPFFAMPRTGTVSFEVGLSPHMGDEYKTIGLAIFTALFFLTALFFALRPGQILVWVGKVLNPLFLFVLSFLIVASVINPMGDFTAMPAVGAYETAPFFKGFLEGYNTMDALASLAFGIIVVQSLKGLGVKSPKGIALGTVKAGAVSILLMGLIYTFLSYIGASSVGTFEISKNGGLALAQVSQHYFGFWGSVLLAIIVTLGCLKTAIGLITACSEIFCLMFPQSLSYKQYVYVFTLAGALVANVGLTQIIALAIPVLMFICPLAVALIVLGLLSPLFKHRQSVYVSTTLFTLSVCYADCLNAMPDFIKELNPIAKLLNFYSQNIPLFDLGLGWVIPMLMGLSLSWILSSLMKKPNKKAGLAG